MAEIDLNSIKGNSRTRYTSDPKDKGKKIDPIISKDKLVKQKKSLLQRLFPDFFDIKRNKGEIKDYLIKDIIVPGIKNGILDMLYLIFFNERRRSSKYNDYTSKFRGTSIVYNNREYNKSYNNNEKKEKNKYDSDDSVDYRNIIVDDRMVADSIVAKMHSIIDDCGAVSVADLLSIVDLTSNYIDNDWGWKHTEEIGVKRVSGGFLIDVTDAHYIGD